MKRHQRTSTGPPMKSHTDNQPSTGSNHRHHKGGEEHEGDHGPPKRTEGLLLITILSIKIVQALVEMVHTAI